MILHYLLMIGFDRSSQQGHEPHDLQKSSSNNRITLVVLET